MNIPGQIIYRQYLQAQKNPHSACAKAGWLSLAVFLKRPQAEYQIGALHER